MPGDPGKTGNIAGIEERKVNPFPPTNIYIGGYITNRGQYHNRGIITDIRVWLCSADGCNILVAAVAIHGSSDRQCSTGICSKITNGPDMRCGIIASGQCRRTNIG